MTAYYNEHDPFAAAWLRELIADNLIAPGEVDERDIQDVTPNDLRPFRQCHFFAGIGVWSLAARIVGIPDDAPLWSGSCPCQPFSAAGKGGGFDDERHLWPAFHYLIEQCAPPVVVGEQVAGADGDTWLDLVSADVDATGYAFGAAETCAAGFGAPHERSRNYWLAHRIGTRLERLGGHVDHWHQPGWVGAVMARPVAEGGNAGGLADKSGSGRRQERANGRGERRGDSAQGRAAGFGDGGEPSGVVDSSGKGEQARSGQQKESERRRGGFDVGRGVGGLADVSHGDGRSGERGKETGTWTDGERWRRPASGGAGGFLRRPGPLNGFWSDADWLRCRDGKWRPVESGAFPLVNAGAFRNRVGLLRGAGNAVTLGQAAGWLQVVAEILVGTDANP